MITTSGRSELPDDVAAAVTAAIGEFLRAEAQLAKEVSKARDRRLPLGYNRADDEGGRWGQASRLEALGLPVVSGPAEFIWELSGAFGHQ